MTEPHRAGVTIVWAACLLVLLAACSGTREFSLTPERALAGFHEASPFVAGLTQDAAGVAIFVGVEGVAEGCPHDGVLVLSGGEREAVVLRCLEEPRAPGGYSYHQLVVLRHPQQVEDLRNGSLDLGGFAHLAPHDDHALEGHEDAPGWIVSTHRSQLLFGDQAVRQRLELAR